MTNTLKLQAKMKENGYTIFRLSREIGLSPTGLFNKIHNQREFLASEISLLSKILCLNHDEEQSIFFANAVELQSTNNKEGKK